MIFSRVKKCLPLTGFRPLYRWARQQPSPWTIRPLELHHSPTVECVDSRDARHLGSSHPLHRNSHRHLLRDPGYRNWG